MDSCSTPSAQPESRSFEEPSKSSDASVVHPDEVLTLGVLALAGLWPGTWNAIAAIMLWQADVLYKRGEGGSGFRPSVRSLAAMLLQQPHDANIAKETWKHIAMVQERLPSRLSSILAIACSLLQGRSLGIQARHARRKRRRTDGAEAVKDYTSSLRSKLSPFSTISVSMIFEDMATSEEEREQRQARADKGMPSSDNGKALDKALEEQEDLASTAESERRRTAEASGWADERPASATPACTQPAPPSLSSEPSPIYADTSPQQYPNYDLNVVRPSRPFVPLWNGATVPMLAPVLPSGSAYGEPDTSGISSSSHVHTSSQSHINIKVPQEIRWLTEGFPQHGQQTAQRGEAGLGCD